MAGNTVEVIVRHIESDIRRLGEIEVRTVTSAALAVDDVNPGQVTPGLGVGDEVPADDGRYSRATNDTGDVRYVGGCMWWVGGRQ